MRLSKRHKRRPDCPQQSRSYSLEASAGGVLSRAESRQAKLVFLAGTVLLFSLRAYRHLASSLSGAYVPPPTTHAPGAKAA
jgi:hypothetical protein